MTAQNQLNLILGRRSIRVYAPGAIDEADVKRLLEAAMAAPSAMTKDPWRFVTVRDANALQRLAGACPGGAMLASASMAIVACGDLQSAFEQNVGYLVQDCSAAIENLLICAHALGLGACWVGVYPADEQMRKVRQIVGLPGFIVPVAVIALGHPGEQLEPRTRYNPAYVHAEKW